jgi:hypothetical protein
VGEAAIARPPPDLDPRRLPVLVRNHDRSHQPRIAPVPAFELELVGGERHGGAEIVVLIALPGGRERIHDRVFDAVEVEVLPAHEVEIAGRQPAAGRPGIPARGQRLALGIGKALGETLPAAAPIGLQVIPPARAQERSQVFRRGLRMNVDIDDGGAGFLLAHQLPGLDVHRTSSCIRA